MAGNNQHIGTQYLLLGQTLSFTSDPFEESHPSDAVQHQSNGAVLIQNGKILDLGLDDDLIRKYPQAQRESYGQDLILSGFIDSHAHYPQTRIVSSWGKRLLDWLENYTFPEEEKFSDPVYAFEIAEEYLQTLLVNGTTTVCSFCTVHRESVEAFFEAASLRGMRVLAGKTCMDCHAPARLVDTVQTAYDDSKSLLTKFHSRGRLSYVITPRFALTSSSDQLRALGELWSEFPDCLMQTHLSEQEEEIALVKQRFPQAEDYLGVYEEAKLLRERGLYGHAIHLSIHERERLAKAKAALIHCPTSNMFIGSGLFDLHELKTRGMNIGLATDTGGGTSFSMLRTMAACYEIGQLKGFSLHPSQLVYLATLANAKALKLDHLIGNLEVGKEADILVLNLRSTEWLASRAERAEDIWQELFPTIMMGDERAVRSLWVDGKCVKSDGHQRD